MNSSNSEFKKTKLPVESDPSDGVQLQKVKDIDTGASSNANVPNELERRSKQNIVNKASINSSIPLRRNISTSATHHQDLEVLKTAYGRLKAITVPNTRVQDLHQPFGPNKGIKGTITTSLHCDLETTAFSLDAGLDGTSAIGTGASNVGNATIASLVNNPHRTMSGANIGKYLRRKRK